MAWTNVASISLRGEWQFTEPVEGSVFRLRHETAPLGGTFVLAQVQINLDNSIEIADAGFYSSSDLPEVILLEKPQYFTSRRIGVKKINSAPGMETELRQLLRPALFNRLAIQPFSPGQASQWKIVVEVSEAVLSAPVSIAQLDSKLVPVVESLARAETKLELLAQQNTDITSQLAALSQSISNISSSTSPEGTSQTSKTYPEEILSNSPYLYLRLGETSGTIANDASPNNRDGVYTGSIILGVTGSIARDSNTAVEFNGTNTKITFSDRLSSPKVFTLDCRFKTTFNGTLFGFYGEGSGLGNYDREFYLTGGKLKFLVYSGSTIVSPISYNNGVWHSATAVYYAGGAEIWVDGALVVSSNNSNSITYEGKWIIGHGSYGNYFKGILDEVSITHSRIMPEQIQKQHQLASI